MMRTMTEAREVVVTGGGTGIGYAVAAAFLKAGDRVTITGRREKVLSEAATLLGAKYVAFDAGDPVEVQAALADLPDRVDVLVNNAGGNTDRTREAPAPGDLSGLADAWYANLKANVLTTVLVTEALRPRLADNGRVISIGSVAAKQGSNSYGAAKAAVEGWNSWAAQGFGKRGITSNVVAPGMVEDTEFFHNTVSEEWIQARIDGTLNKRAGTVDDVAATVFFVASEGAGHITGQVIHVNGGAYGGH